MKILLLNIFIMLTTLTIGIVFLGLARQFGLSQRELGTGYILNEWAFCKDDLTECREEVKSGDEYIQYLKGDREEVSKECQLKK
jgi:hypothetical protein